MLQYNWDNLAGVISGLCFAWNYRVTYHSGVTSVNLLFDYKDENICIKSPYCNDGVCTITLSKSMPVRIRLSDLTDKTLIIRVLDQLGVNYTIDHNWLYLTELPVNKPIAISMHFVKEIRDYTFNDHALRFQFEGDHILAAASNGKRLCFFPNLEGREEV